MTHELSKTISGFNRRTQWGPRMYGRRGGLGRSTLRGCDPTVWPVDESTLAYCDSSIIEQLGRRLYNSVVGNGLYGGNPDTPRLEVWR